MKQAKFGALEDVASAASVAALSETIDTLTENVPPITPNTILVDNADGTARENKTFAEVLTLLGIPSLLSPVLTYRSFSQVTALEISAAQKVLKVAGYASEGDGGSTQWKRVAAAPSHGAGLRSLDRYLPNGTTDETNGGWWDLDEERPNELMLGGVASRTNAQQTAAIQALLNHCGTTKLEATIATGHLVTATLTVPDFVTVNFAKRGYSGSGAMLDKVFNGDMIIMGNAAVLNSPALQGNSGSWTGRGIVINTGADQVINDPCILGMASYCLEFPTGGQGIRFKMNGGLIQSASGYAVRMPATEATTTGFRQFANVHTGGTPFVDFRNGNYTMLEGCVFTDINYGSTATGRTKVANCRIASVGGVLVFGTEHVIMGNTCGSNIVLGSGATRCAVVGNVTGAGVTNSSGNSTNILSGNV